jgi:hypothetical protein
MRTLLIALVLLLPAAARASDDKVEVPFLFTDDQAAPQADPSQSIKPTDVLRTDAYLNAPMTRLEYMLTRMEMRLNNETTVAVIKPKFPVSQEGIALILLMQASVGAWEFWLQGEGDPEQIEGALL